MASDVALTAAMLRIVNSPAYALKRQCDTVDQAVRMMGLKQIGQIVTGVMLRKSIRTDGPQLTRFWDVSSKRSFALSRLAVELGGGTVDVDVAQSFGLFCDVGIPLLMQRFPDYGQTLKACNDEKVRSVTDVEQERHSTDHALIGSVMARSWGISKTVCQAIRLHHDYSIFQDASIPDPVCRLIAMGLDRRARHPALRPPRHQHRVGQGRAGGAGALVLSDVDAEDSDRAPARELRAGHPLARHRAVGGPPAWQRSRTARRLPLRSGHADVQDALWFKTEFQPQIEAQPSGTPFSVDMITAFACQETGEIWPTLRRQGLPTARILELCVGDTIDASPTGGGRRAFPRTKAELLGAPRRPHVPDRAPGAGRHGAADPRLSGRGGAAGQVLPRLRHLPARSAVLQDRARLLSRPRYADFDTALGRCIGELKAALQRLGWQAKTSLSDTEMAAVAIAYNTGRYDPAKGLKQGYFDGAKYYGENYFAFLQLAKGAQVAVGASATAPTTRGGPPKSAKKRASEEGDGEEVDQEVDAKKAAEEGRCKKATVREAAEEEGTRPEDDREEGREETRREEGGRQLRSETTSALKLSPAPSRCARSSRQRPP